MAEENGSRWHGALLSCALTVPRMIEEAMIVLLVVQVLPVTRLWANTLTAGQQRAAMALVRWQILASAHNFTLAALHGSHAHYVGLYRDDPEYLLLLYDGLLLAWTLVLLAYVAGTVPAQATLQQQQQQGTRRDAQELVPGMDLVIDVDGYPPRLVGGTILVQFPVSHLPVVDAVGEGAKGPEGGYIEGLPSDVATRARRHSHKLLHKHWKHHYREFM